MLEKYTAKVFDLRDRQVKQKTFYAPSFMDAEHESHKLANEVEKKGIIVGGTTVMFWGHKYDK